MAFGTEGHLTYDSICDLKPLVGYSDPLGPKPFTAPGRFFLEEEGLKGVRGLGSTIWSFWVLGLKVQGLGNAMIL